VKGVCSLAALLIFSLRCFRRPSYEIFLRAHQGCAALTAYALWRHINKRSAFPGTYSYIIAGLFLSSSLLEALMTIYRNFTFRRGYARASVRKSRGAVRMSIDVPRSWNIQAGQYINIWFPAVGFRALFETRPFMIVSWTKRAWEDFDSDAATLASWNPAYNESRSIELLIEPRDGFTRRLLRHSETSQEADKRLIVYTGPHGSPGSTKSFGTVLMIASGFGVAAQLPHVKELLDGYRACEVVTRRVHLVWQLKEQGQSVLPRSRNLPKRLRR